MSTGYESNYPASGYASESQIRNEFEKIQQALEDTISRSGASNSSGTDNTMSTFLNMDGNDIINADVVQGLEGNFQTLLLAGQDVQEVVNAAQAEADRAKDEADRAEQAADDLEGPYEFVGDYVPDIILTKYKQIVRDSNGEFWRISGQVELPYTTTGTGLPEGSAFIPSGDAVLRQDLANPDKGAAMVAYQGGSVSDKLDEIVSEVVSHYHDYNAHPELRTRIVSEVSSHVTDEADRAEAARDAAFVNADVFPDIATGLEAVADGEQFQVVEGDEVVRYRRDSGSTQTEMARYPAAHLVRSISAKLPSMLRQVGSIAEGLGVTNIGERFLISEDEEASIYRAMGNLYNPSDAVEGRYINTTSGVSYPAEGWAHSADIAVTPGAKVSISSNASRRQGIAFYTSDGTPILPVDTRSVSSLTITAPVSAAYMRFNVKSPDLPEPSEIMVNFGEPFDFLPFGQKIAAKEDTLLSSDHLEDALLPMVRQARDVSSGLAVTKMREQFMVSSHNGTVLYEVFGNLFDPVTVIEDHFISLLSGESTQSAGWAHTDYIRVVPGTRLSISSNTERPSGVSFYTEDKTWTGDSSSSLLNPLSLEVPANAAYVRFNVKSDTISQPTEIMANEGDPIPYMPFGYKEAIVVSETPDKTALSQVLDFYTSDNLFVPRNISKDMYISSSLYTLQSAPGWSVFVVPATEGDIFTIYSPIGTPRRPGAAFFSTANPLHDDTCIDGSYTGGGGAVTLTAPAGTQSLVVNVESPADPLPDDLMIVRGATQIPYMPGGDLLFVKRSSIRPEIDNGGSDTKSLTINLSETDGQASSLSSSLTGYAATFIAYPEERSLQHPVRFNFRSDVLDEVPVRQVTDDIAPDHIDGWTVGANHGYTLGVCTAAAHGKVAGDSGSIWSNGGATYVLADVPDADTVLLALESTNADVPAGTYTHVSGATNTSDIIVSGVSMKQWYPPHRDYVMRTIADGKVVEDRGTVFADSVQFVESASICSRSDIIDAWVRDGGMPASYQPDAEPSIAQTITYKYDKRGQATIARDWLFLKGIPVKDLMGLQALDVGAEQYIVPGSLPFQYDGVTVDYSMGVAADNTLESGVSVDFTSSMLQAEGEYANRALVMYPDSVFALGFLPVGDAAFSVRRERVSNLAMQIRGNTGKLYFRVLDKGGHIATPGDHYSVVGYRVLIPRSPDRTAFYAIEGGGSTWVYADWHNKDGLDRLPIDEQYPELIGRSFEIVEARNVTVSSGVIAGNLPVIVSAGYSSATLILKVQ